MATQDTTGASTPASVPSAEAPFKFDEYWLAKGKTFADNTLSTLTKTMQHYVIFINSLIGATFLGGLTLSTYLSTTTWYVYLLFVVPMIFILIARYKIGVEISRPTYQNPDLRSPIQINNAFNTIVDSRREQIRQARKWVGSSLVVFCVCIPAAVFLYNLVSSPTLNQYVHFDASDKVVSVKAVLPEVEKVRLQWIGVNDKKKERDTLRMSYSLNKYGKLDLVFSKKELGFKRDVVNLIYLKDEKTESYSYKL